MGEIAELMLDGTLCESCGVYLGATDMDCPCLCSECAKDRYAAGHAVKKIGRVWIDGGTRKSTPKKANRLHCPTCAKMVKPLGMADHNRVMHGMAAHKEQT